MGERVWAPSRVVSQGLIRHGAFALCSLMIQGLSVRAESGWGAPVKKVPKKEYSEGGVP